MVTTPCPWLQLERMGVVSGEVVSRGRREALYRDSLYKKRYAAHP